MIPEEVKQKIINKYYFKSHLHGPNIQAAEYGYSLAQQEIEGKNKIIEALAIHLSEYRKEMPEKFRELWEYKTKDLVTKYKS